ncbi:aldose 1-epimerase [Neiella marina]|uniref:Aldose 1-epimerase n=2 Tax=Neiella marina TaxID=508461 RepID=A0A8J2U1F7_9GAMM|nr:aldose 1-epimerase [Neiella marina]
MQSVLLANEHLRVMVLPLGARIHGIQVNRGEGDWQQTVVGYDNLTDYQADTSYLGCTAGRYANRIAGAMFELDGQSYQLEANEGANLLHGGINGFHNQQWRIIRQHDTELTLAYHSADGEAGFPGNLDVLQTISLVDSEVHIKYWASADKPTVVNLTNHCYFNLAKHQDTRQHWLQLRAQRFVEVADTGIPTGALLKVDDTPFDFSTSTEIAKQLSSHHPQLAQFEGFDHNFEIHKNKHSALQDVAVLYAPDTDLSLVVATTQPGLQFYSGQYLSAPFQAHQGICLEAQQFPDAPNQPNFPITRVDPHSPYQHSIVYRFAVGHVML